MPVKIYRGGGMISHADARDLGDGAKLEQQRRKIENNAFQAVMEGLRKEYPGDMWHGDILLSTWNTGPFGFNYNLVVSPVRHSVEDCEIGDYIPTSCLPESARRLTMYQEMPKRKGIVGAVEGETILTFLPETFGPEGNEHTFWQRIA